MNHIKINIILILLAYVSVCLSQDSWEPGYIIKNEGDTVFGFIENRDSRSNSIQCIFRKEAIGETQFFSPQQLKGYRYINGKFFVSKDIGDTANSHWVFLEYMIYGKVHVFHLKDKNDRYFAEKEGVIYELKNTVVVRKIKGEEFTFEKEEYKGMLNFLFNDTGMRNDITRCNFAAKSLIDIAKQYHEKVCFDEKCVVYEKSIRPLHVNKGIIAGFSLNKFQFGNQMQSGLNPSGALGCRFELENIMVWKEHISLVLDVSFQYFTRYTFSSLLEDDPLQIEYDDQVYIMNKEFTGHYYNYPEITELDVNIKTLVTKIPLSVNYSFLKKNMRPYFGAGIANMFVISQNKEFKYKRFYNLYNKSIPTYHIGIIARAGTQFMLKNNHELFMDLNYEYTQTTSNDNLRRVRSHLFSWIIGYTI